MNPSLILTDDMPLYHVFKWMVEDRRIVFFAGLAGVGKTLLLQQLAFMAQDAGRVVHTMQWDRARLPFETATQLQKYPEVAGVTHATLRKAVGLWSREAVLQWHADFAEPEHMLIGEVPLIGNRLSELVTPLSDLAEPLLQSNQTVFAIPMPSREVREVIEAARKRSIAQPRNDREKHDASPLVLQGLWHEIYELAGQLELSNASIREQIPYDPEVYSGVYQHLLKHRHAQVLPVKSVLVPRKSAYDYDIKGTELLASAEKASQIIARIEAVYTSEQLNESVANWYKI